MAYIKKRGKTWSVQISWYSNDERKYKTKSGFATKRDAQKWANEMCSSSRAASSSKAR